MSWEREEWRATCREWREMYGNRARFDIVRFRPFNFQHG